MARFSTADRLTGLVSQPLSAVTQFRDSSFRLRSSRNKVDEICQQRFDRSLQLRSLECRGRSSSGLCDLPKNPHEVAAGDLGNIALRIAALQQTRRN
jgi:hypothetical protein